MNNALWPRRCGILLHITSLPGRYGIGDLGPGAYKFVDWLVEAKQSIWNILPLNPTAYGDSPYSGTSVFAGNSLLISLDRLVDDGWLEPSEVENVPDFPESVVWYEEVIPYHSALLKQAYDCFSTNASISQRKAFTDWCESQSYWLEDFALFMTLKNIHEGAPFTAWNPEEIRREPETLALIRSQHIHQVEQHKFEQWQFFKQWESLKAYANSHGIKIMGDMPIYTGSDCSEVWARSYLFNVDEMGRPVVVAGVPPDYFSATGSLWGNPIYRWEIHCQNGFEWWVERIRIAFELYDICLIDHFRGFAAYWEVPGDASTAINGRWVEGAGQPFFDAVFSVLPNIKLVAEDVGSITPDVEELRDKNGIPGMAILQFAWSNDLDDSFLPHNHRNNQVVYTGTHNNDTTMGWWNRISEQERTFFTQYTHDQEEPNWTLIRLAMMSIAHTSIIPIQDIFGFAGEARMNYPGNPSGNWCWRITYEWLDNPAKHRLGQFALMYARTPKS